MEAAVRARFDESALDALLAAWGTPLPAAEFLQDSFNIVYRLPDGVAGHPGAAFLRISHSSRRPVARVAAELDWLTFLAQRDLPVCRPLPTQARTALALAADDSAHFVGALFAAVPGMPVDARGWNDALFRRLGMLLAKLHAAARAYVPPAGRRRAHWHEEDSLPQLRTGLGAAADAPAGALLEKVRTQMSAWPTPPAAYGLIHGDVHAGNFHLHQGVVHLFDFDDCCYHWFATDIANAVYYAVWHQARYETPGADPAGFAVRFARTLLDGYSAVASPPPDLGRQLPLLIDYRDLLVYAYLRRRYGETPPSAALATLLEQRRRRFLEARPYVAVDWLDVVRASRARHPL